MKYETAAGTQPVNKLTGNCRVAKLITECGMTYDVKPSTHIFFQMFLLWKSSGKDRWGREEGAGSESSSAENKQDKNRVSLFN